MPDYTYKAVDQTGKVKTGIRFAADMTELREHLRRSGLSLLAASEKQSAAFFESLKNFRLGGITRRQLVEFSNNVGVMIKAGVPLITCLDELRDDTDIAYVKNVLGNIIKNLQEGDPLHKAMAKRPKDFPELYVNLVEIGEETGRLSDIFFNNATYYKRIDDLIGSVRKALFYPLFVLVTMVMASFIFITMVFPPLFKLLEEFNVTMPLITDIVMAVSSVLKNHWYIIVPGFVFLIFAVIIMRQYKPTRYWFDWTELNIPFFKRVFIQLRMTFFLRYLALLLTAGIDILRGLRLSAASVNNLVVRKEMEACRERLVHGSTFSTSLSQISFVPNMVSRMVAVGEFSGNLPEQMDYLANVYHEEFNRQIDIALAALEPILIFIIAGMALTLVMGVLLPLYNMVSTLSTGAGTGGI